MGWTKRDLVLQALDELGIPSSTFDMDVDRLQSFMRRMDAMMASWNAQGIRLSYPVPSSPTAGDLDDESGLPDIALEAVFTAVAVLIAPSLGKVVSETTKQRAKNSLDTLMIHIVKPSPKVLPATLPSGAGNLATQPFISPTPEPLRDGAGGELTFLG